MKSLNPLSIKFKRYQAAKHTLTALKNENKILRSEINRLQRRIKTLGITISDHDNDVQRLWSNAKTESALLSGTSYVKYSISKITGGSLFSLWKRVSSFFRKFRLISTIMRVISSLLTILGTGAFFIFISGALVFIIPFITIFSASLYVLDTISRTSSLRALKTRIEEKNVYVFFPQRGRPFENGSSFEHTVSMISRDDNNFVIIISPYIFSSEGSTDGYYTILSFNTENTCIIRKHAFFSLRRKLLESTEKQTVYIH